MNKTILIVEDEIRLSDSLCRHLNAASYTCLQAFNGTQALELFSKSTPDLIILDVMLPDMSGIEICKKIRSISQAPIIMVTARIEELDRLKGFEVGADDYVCKPFSPKELIFRIQAILRRVETLFVTDATPPPVIEYGPISFFSEQYRVTVDNKIIALTTIEFQLLSVLISDPIQVFSRADLLTAAHGKYSENYDRTIDTHIKNLRKKLNARDKYNFIKTVYGVGYKLST